MDIYDNRRDYLINYEIEDNKIIEFYFDGEPATVIPYTEHNKAIVDRRLESQWKSFITSSSYRNLLDKEKSWKLYNKIFIGCAIADYFIRPNNVLTYINLGCFAATSLVLYSFDKKLKRHKATEFCMNNIDEVNKVLADDDARSHISGTKSKVFSLNNQHEFTTSDLCFIKSLVKVNRIGDSNGRTR